MIGGCPSAAGEANGARAAVTAPALTLLKVVAFAGTVIVLAIAGSSRRCRYNSPLLGRGTASVGFVAVRYRNAVRELRIR